MVLLFFDGVPVVADACSIVSSVNAATESWHATQCGFRRVVRHEAAVRMICDIMPSSAPRVCTQYVHGQRASYHMLLRR